MKKTPFCDNWYFCETGKMKTPVLLPHDATQCLDRAPDAPSGSGGAYYPGGCFTYTKAFEAPEAWRGRYASLLFEGVYPLCRVLLNGEEIGGCAYGYSQFEVELTGLRYGQINEVTVIADNSETPNSRWYQGAGIYRPVWLLTGGAARILRDGVRVTTLSYDPAEIRVDTAHTGGGRIAVEILDGKSAVARGEGESVRLSVPDAKLWDAEHPHLYTCRVTLTDGGGVLDEAETAFGIRKIEFSADGLFINGRETLLRGGCIHSDSGILGSRTFDESEWRRVRILREHGFNAIRSAHNPLCRAALEACDALGMYVMDETWDMWDKHKTDCDYASRFPANWKNDVRELVAKDYNHPCVILYSIGNEVTEPARPAGVRLAGEIIAEVKRHDVSRPVTAGINVALLTMAGNGIPIFEADKPKEDRKPEEKKDVSSTLFNEMVARDCQAMVDGAATPEADALSTPLLDQLDIAGYNYGQTRYENDQALHPGRVVVGSETFPQDLPGNWALVKKLPWVIGDFMWTAWDYIGEVGIGSWVADDRSSAFAKPYPWKLGDTGALDILGHETAEAGMAAVVWGARKEPYIAVRPILPEGRHWLRAMWRGSNAIPSWSWKGCEGRGTEVEVYTAAPEAELFINGVSVGRQAVRGCKAVFPVAYRPGELRAAACYADGTRVECALRSADGGTRVVIAPETAPEIGRPLYLDISLRGENGEIESNADETLTVAVEGGRLLAFGSARPDTEAAFHTGVYPTYYGRALAVVLPEESGLRVTARGESARGAWEA